MTFRTYFQVPGADTSRLAEQVGRQRDRVATRLSRVERVVAVLSGKGGVGKSYVTGALAIALARRGLGVGVVDADLQSPTVARLLGARAAGSLLLQRDGVRPGIGRHGVRVISSDLLIDEGRAFRWTSTVGEQHVWRGASEAGVLREFLGDVRWGSLAALLVDLPPDASRLTDLATLVPGLTGIAVTIPTPESERSVARALDAAHAAGVPIMGIVENLSGYVCRCCQEVGPLFDGDAGLRLSTAHTIPLLAQIPFSRAPLDDIATMLEPVADAVLRYRSPS
jgi:ATP-binding protein involved in chromosome partitioning